MNFEFIKPNLESIQQMQNLVANDVQNGNILSRDESEMATTIRSYIAVQNANNIIGFVALHIHTGQLAEIRSLVVHEDYRGQGLGKQLVYKAIEEARMLKIDKILVLTYKEQMFKHLDFEVIDKESIPDSKIWADCIKCKHFPRCDEVALIKELH